MAGAYPYTARIVSPVKCNEKPWDLWVSEIGHSSPRRDPDGVEEARHKPGRTRYRRAGINRLRHNTMNLHGLFPQSDNLNAAVCHMCGVTVKCSAAYRHLLESHACSDPILPPPPPTVKLKSSHSRSRHKKELLPPPSVDMLPVKLESSPLLTATTPLSRLVVPPPDAVPYLDEASTSAAVSGEVQVHVERGELPVVSIQDTAELPLGEHMTDDIFAIMNSEGIQTAEDSTDWKNIIKDINMQDLNFQPPDSIQGQELYGAVDPSALTYALTEPDLSSFQLAPSSSSILTNVIDSTPQTLINAQVPKPAPVPVPAPPTKSQSRSKSSKTKFNLREYDPNKHCGVVTVDNPKPCTRSLTCKVHALSLRRLVEGRIKPFDMLLAEHRAARDPANNANALTTAHTTHTTPTVELASINGLITDSQVSDLYATLLGVEEPVTIPEPTVINIPVVAPPVIDTPIQDRREEAPSVVPNDVCWYTSSPRPLALCTFNTSHAGGAITLGKKFATVRSNIKSSLSRSQSKSTAGSSSSYYFGQSPLSWSKSIHMNNVRQKPEVRRVVVRCAATSGRGAVESGRDVRLNGHVAAVLKSRPLLDLGFGLDPLLADDKC